MVFIKYYWQIIFYIWLKYSTNTGKQTQINPIHIVYTHFCGNWTHSFKTIFKTQQMSHPLFPFSLWTFISLFYFDFYFPCSIWTFSLYFFPLHNPFLPFYVLFFTLLYSFYILFILSQSNSRFLPKSSIMKYRVTSMYQKFQIARYIKYT